MLIDTEPVSRWYVINKGLKVYSSCPKCANTNVLYKKAWMKGHYGVAPECNVCQKNFPIQMKKKNLSK